MRRPKLDEGFTLIELLVVVIILGILSAIVVFSIGNARDNAVNRSCTTNAQQLVRALELYKASTGSYPTADASSVVSSSTLSSTLVPKYLKAIPSSPDYTFTVKANNTTDQVYVSATSTTVTTGFSCAAGTLF